MKRIRYTEEQIAFALRQGESGTPIAEIVRKMGITEQTALAQSGGLRRKIRKSALEEQMSSQEKRQSRTFPEEFKRDAVNLIGSRVTRFVRLLKRST